MRREFGRNRKIKKAVLLVAILSLILSGEVEVLADYEYRDKEVTKNETAYGDGIKVTTSSKTAYDDYKLTEIIYGDGASDLYSTTTYVYTRTVTTTNTTTLSADTGGIISNVKTLVTGGTAYTELRTGANGTYISDSNTTATNLKELDTQLSTLHNTKIAVANGTDSISIDTATNASTGEVTYTIGVDTSMVAENDTGLLTSQDAYTELRPTNGSYVKQSDTTATNLSALDTAIGKTSQGNYIVAQDGTATANVATNLTNLDTKIGAAKGVIGLYAEESDVESQIQAVGNKTIQSITNAVSNGASDTQKITVKTYDGTTTNIEIAGQGAVASGDVRILNGDTIYNELRPTDGNYIKQGDTTASNLTALDTQVKINENNIRDLTGEVHQIGAGAAALAALRPEPYDPDDRWSFAAGIGHYKNGNAAALGVFFKPDENTTFSFGSTVWSGDPMINFGASFKVGSRSPYAGTYRNTKKLIERVDAIEKGNVERDATIAAQAKEIELLKADNAQMKADNAQMKAQIAEILAKLGMTKDVEKTAIVKSGPRPFLKDLVKAESKPVAKAKIKSPIKVKTKAATKSESKPVEKATAKPVAKPSVKPVAKTDAKAEAKAEVKAVSKTEAKTAIKSETTVKPIVKETVKPEAKTPAKPETKTSGQTGGRPFLKELVKTDANATDKAAATSATKADADKTADKAEAKTVSKEETKTATQAKGRFVVL